MTPFGARRDGAGCPSGLELTVAISDGADAALAAHVRACPRCAARWHELARPRDLARQLPPADPSAAELEQSRTRLLIAFADQRSGLPGGAARFHRRRIAVLAASIAVAAGLAVAWRMQRPPTPAARQVEIQTHHATVHLGTGAAFERLGSAADDVVRLRNGVARFDVRPLGARERFRVVAGNGEVEVRGTAFQVTVAGDRLSAVHVEHGRVEVRADGRGVVVLGPGDDWTSPPPAPGRTSATMKSSAAEAAFVEGWDAFRGGRLVGAIEAFEDVLRLDPTGSLAEDARYWKAVARARTGSRSAIEELRSFVRDYPASAHADDASLLLGWKLQEADRARDRDGSVTAPGRPGNTSRRTSP